MDTSGVGGHWANDLVDPMINTVIKETDLSFMSMVVLDKALLKNINQMRKVKLIR